MSTEYTIAQLLYMTFLRPFWRKMGFGSEDWRSGQNQDWVETTELETGGQCAKSFHSLSVQRVEANGIPTCLTRLHCPTL